MNHELLSKQLIRALRGRRSQVALSRRMKCKSNVLYTWESGRRWPTAAVFFHLAERVGVDVPKGIANFLGTVPDDLVGRDFAESKTVATFLSHPCPDSLVHRRELVPSFDSPNLFLSGDKEKPGTCPVFLV